MASFLNKPKSEWTDEDRATKAAWDAFGPDDERKIKCIHCGTVWYEIHFKDGLCHTCHTNPDIVRKYDKSGIFTICLFAVFILILMMIIVFL